MKKIISVLVIAVSISMAMPVQAQLKLGVKGGVNLVSAPSTDISATDVKSSTGFFVGPMIDFSIPIIGIGFDASLLYSQKGNKFNEETVLQQGVEIPVNLKYSIGLGDLASVFVAAGPSAFINFNSGAQSIVPKATSLGDLKNSVNYKAFELSINAGVGAKLLNHFQVGLNYNMPVTNSAQLTDTVGLSQSSSIKTKTWQVSLAYLF
jgi:opacity protein-like surface antigen